MNTPYWTIIPYVSKLIYKFSFLIHSPRENSGHAGEGLKSLRRGTSIIQMAPDIDPSSWDHRELDKYGLGTGQIRFFLVSIFKIITFTFYCYREKH